MHRHPCGALADRGGALHGALRVLPCSPCQERCANYAASLTYAQAACLSPFGTKQPLRDGLRVAVEGHSIARRPQV